jgi:two-component system cell cycle response regulator
MEEEVKRAVRYKHPVSLIMLDIDHFKDVNDTYGHQVGDSALRWMAEIIRASVRDADFASRYGGEEFAIICGETDLREAVVIADRIRAAVEAAPFMPDPTQSIPVTTSAGVACFPANGPQDVDLIRAADEALYEAKRSGRNRVMTSQKAAERARRTA